MNEADVLANAEALLSASVRLARGSGFDPAMIEAHCRAVADGRRALVVQIARSGRSLAVQAWTQPVDTVSPAERHELLALSRRSAELENWNDESGC